MSLDMICISRKKIYFHPSRSIKANGVTFHYTGQTRTVTSSYDMRQKREECTVKQLMNRTPVLNTVETVVSETLNLCAKSFWNKPKSLIKVKINSSNIPIDLDLPSSPGPCVRKIVLVGILWTLKFLCRNLQFKWCWIEKKLSAIFPEPFRPVLCKLDMTSLYSWWMTTKCLQFDSRLCESNIIMHLQLQFTSHFDCFKEWTNGPNI